MDALWIALALVLVLEGLGPMLFPNKWQRFMSEMANQPVQQLRTLGGAMVTIGAVVLVFLLS
ncbi:DUF2065 domain-containing protein [Aestuariibacter salexigens]|uniref:DUF2065 domain-containing protein n=1 Tax=Aestuariibacter salexigens TaxID=226010 RepID=UPI0004035847|nr:DUF2065 domain-containing protein [Aestuariibacter salexigens]